MVEALPKDRRVVVENINVVKRHRRPRPIQNSSPIGGAAIMPGGSIDQAAPLPVSNVMVVCPTRGKPTRVGTVERTMKDKIDSRSRLQAVRTGDRPDMAP